MVNKVEEISRIVGGKIVSENIRQREAVDRRRFLKGAATVAWAAPVIATLSASPAYAVECIPEEGQCTKSGTACLASFCCSLLSCKPGNGNKCRCLP